MKILSKIHKELKYVHKFSYMLGDMFDSDDIHFASMTYDDKFWDNYVAVLVDYMKDLSEYYTKKYNNKEIEFQYRTMNTKYTKYNYTLREINCKFDSDIRLLCYQTTISFSHLEYVRVIG